MIRKDLWKVIEKNAYDLQAEEAIKTAVDAYSKALLQQTPVSGSFGQYGIFCCCKARGLFWFRVFGYGLHFKNIKKRFLLFSERNGYRKRVQLGNWSIRTLVP